ncbi:hypothetical protein [Spirosoma litoris]
MLHRLFIASTLVLAPLAVASAQNVVVIQQSGTNSHQAHITQTGADNVATIRQGSPADTAQSAPVVITTQTNGGQTVIHRTQTGHSIYVQQTSPSTTELPKKTGKTSPK